ncbi:transposable element Tcb2 transposase [Trichonephila clavipes]|nr:transposable element Tcb2 transposase [Trichonephila clavipes]
MEFEQEIVQKNYFVSQLQEFYPYCTEDTDKSTPEKIVLRINLENEEAENFKNHYSVVSNTNWIVYGCTPNPQRFVFSKTWICHHSKRHKQNAKRNADCKAKLCIVVKKITKATKKKDKYLKYDIPLVGEVKISLLHSHNTTSAETLRMLRVNDKTTSGCFYPRSNHWEKLEEGRSVTSVAAEFGIAHSIVSRLWRQFQTTGTAIRGLSSGRPRGTTPEDDRYIVLQARRNRRQTAGEISRHTTQATGRPISRFTVARRLHGGGLFARRPVRRVSLTPAHRRRRSLWWREHGNWRDNEWGRVLFTDESRFCLSSDSHRILIWRERGSRNHPSNIIERDRYGGRGVLVWGGIMLGSRTDLHIFDAGLVNETRYCNEILFKYVRLFRGAMGLQFLFMDDNAPCHRTVPAEQLLESEDIERMDWPARSPDLNPIEHVWDFLGRRLAARTLPPVTIRELLLALQDEWAAMPQQLIDTLILSMGRRCETCLAVRGDHIPY